MRPDSKKMTIENCKDSGLALVLICLLCYQVWKLPVLMLLTIVFLLMAMTYPPLFRPFASFWFRLSTILGTVASKILLTLLFYGLVLPVGVLRRSMGKDAMRIRSWKRGNASVFRVRDHRFEAKDLEHPY